MKLARSLLLIVAFGAIVRLIGCRQASDDSESDAVPPGPAQVRVATASKMTLRPSIDLIGTAVPVPERTAEVSTQIEGTVARVVVVEGQAVRAGELLVQLDDRLAAARLASARAAEHRATAGLDKLRNGPRKEELEAARQNALQLSAVVRSQRAKLEALRPLHEKGDVSDVEYGQAQARVEAAEAESAAADARVRLLEAGSRKEDIAVAEAELAAARADLTAACLAVEFCAVAAPIDGVVVDLSVRAGASVSPTDTLARLLDTSELFVRARIPSARLPQVRSGAPADVWIGRNGNNAIHGSIARLSPLADAASGDVDAFISVPNPDGALRPGLSCRVRVWLPELVDVLVIPVAAVADRDGEAVVTQIRDDKAYELPVQLGITTRDYVQVLDGLANGDIVATEGGYGLPEGCPVRIAPGPE
jgi:HlyD family secretion protein